MSAQTHVDFHVKCPLLLLILSNTGTGQQKCAKIKFHENTGIFSGSGVVSCNQRDGLTEQLLYGLCSYAKAPKKEQIYNECRQSYTLSVERQFGGFSSPKGIGFDWNN
jgi:hypothetical protein